MLRAVPWLLSGWRELQRLQYLLSLWHSQPGFLWRCWPRQDWKEGGMWASYGQQGHCEGIIPGPTAPSPPAVAERRGLA